MTGTESHRKRSDKLRGSCRELPANLGSLETCLHENNGLRKKPKAAKKMVAGTERSPGRLSFTDHLKTMIIISGSLTIVPLWSFST